MRPAWKRQVKPGRPDRRGLAILDVLFGIAIFALIVIIAIQSIGLFRARAFELRAILDAESIGKMIAGSDEHVGGPQAASRLVDEADFLLVSFDPKSKVSHRASSDLASIDDPVDYFDLNLTEGNSLTNWSVSSGSGDFAFCIEHESGPWALFRSDVGGIGDHGRAGSCPFVNFDDNSHEEPAPVKPSESSDPEPAPVESSESSDPEPVPEEPAPVVVPGNSTCSTATELDQPNQNWGVSSTGTQTNLGSPDSSVWFHTFAPVMAYSTYALTDPVDGQLTGEWTVEVYQSEDSFINNQECPANLTLRGASTGNYPGVSLRTGSGNGNYWIKVSSASSSASDFVLDLHFHRSEIVRDRFGAAEPVSGNANQTVTINPGLQTTLWATLESGESLPEGTGSVWYALHNYWSSTTPTTTFEVMAPTDGRKPIGKHRVDVFSGATSAANTGTLVASTTGDGSSSVTFSGPNNGGKYMVRVSSTSGKESGSYSVKVKRVN